MIDAISWSGLLLEKLNRGGIRRCIGLAKDNKTNPCELDDMQVSNPADSIIWLL